MSDDRELEIIIHPEAQAEMDKIAADDPDFADALKGMLAAMRQAVHGVKSGQYDSFDDAMEAITGNRPKKIDLDE